MRRVAILETLLKTGLVSSGASSTLHKALSSRRTWWKTWLNERWCARRNLETLYVAQRPDERYIRALSCPNMKNTRSRTAQAQNRGR